MGPKSKGKGKKKADKQKKVAEADAANAQPEVPMEDGTKQFYLTQIQSLKKKVAE